MKIYQLPQKTKTIIFDIDGTLYTSSKYVFEQVDIQIRYFAHLNNITEQEARKKISDYRKQWSQENGGKKISLGNTLIAFGISIETSIEWRNKLLEPEKYLCIDKKLQQTIKDLNKDFNLICVTNNPVDAARRTLKAIGVADLIPQIIGLDTCKKSKPAKELLELAAKQTDSTFEQCVSIGDRYDIDIDLALQLGMGGILVNGVEDIYNLRGILYSK